MDKKFERISNKSWEDLTKSDLEYLVFEKNFIKFQIANMFNVTKNQVSYKLKKFDISIQKKMLGDALDHAIQQTKKLSLQELIFATNNLNENDNDENELFWGPVKVVNGKFKGRIGCFDDEEGSYGYVYWGNMVSSLDSCDRIKLDCLSSNITTYDLYSRASELNEQIAKMRFEQVKNSSIEGYKTITNLYGEYVYIMGLLNKVYEDTFYLDNTSNKKIFLSYSSKNQDIALMFATDLKRAKYKVWFDVWDIEGGHSIPEEISKGIESSDALVMLVSKNYIESTFCRDEWQSFYMLYNKIKPNAIIPIIIDDSQTPAILANRRYLKLTEQHNYNQVLTELKRALKKL